MNIDENNSHHLTDNALSLEHKIKTWGKELGFADVGITDTNLSSYEAQHFNWIGENFHGEMEYMARHGTKRTRPQELEPGTTSIISVRMNYFDLESISAIEQLHQPEQAYLSRYALGKDYHKILRKRLQALANRIDEHTENFAYRAFTDSAPVLERPIAEKAGLGFIGKNSLIIHPRAGSWFFLGEIYSNLPLKPDTPFSKQGCGPCKACIIECPTEAIVDNAIVDSRRCISYLTIEYKGTIPLEFREAIGNRVYGCDDCQLVCPWNKFTEPNEEAGFKTNKQLDNVSLLSLWQWDEQKFLKQFEGSPIRRIGYKQWKRNLAVSIGNIQAEEPSIQQAIDALESSLGKLDPLVDEHIDWAIKALNLRLQSMNLGSHSSLNSSSKNQSTRPGQFEKLSNPKQIKPFVAKKYYLPK